MILNSKYYEAPEDGIKKFPHLLAQNISVYNLIGSKVEKPPGLSAKFCPMCDCPMVVRVQMMPCEHVLCYECSKPQANLCYMYDI
jgi:hypothetical protein